LALVLVRGLALPVWVVLKVLAQAVLVLLAWAALKALVRASALVWQVWVVLRVLVRGPLLVLGLVSALV
jgi:hypothetical protein